MANSSSKTHCIKCGKEKRAVRCEGCLQLFCYDHFLIHREELNQQLDELESNRDLFRQTLNEQTNHPQVHLLIKQIDQWEKDSIKTIQQTASDCRQLLIQHTTRNVHQIELNLSKLTNQLRDIRQENDFNEYDLNQFSEKSKQLAEQLDQLSNITIRHESSQLVNKISVVVSLSASDISLNVQPTLSKRKWKQFGSTIAGGCGEGSELNQLFYPDDMYIDDEDQRFYIADSSNHRIVKWKPFATSGQVVAGGNGQGNRINQLNQPTHAVLDKSDDSFVICDRGNGRVIRWSRNNEDNHQIIVSNIDCSCVALDSNGCVYISDWEENEVTRWRQGDTKGTVVAGGNNKGNQLNQLYRPSYVFVDEDHSIYISDCENHRVMKWSKGGKEGSLVAGGHGQGNSLTQLSSPTGLAVDDMGNVYIADCYNHRVVRWTKGAKEGIVVVGGNGRGKQMNQFSCPTGVAIDRQNNLYVVDWGNNRVQKFELEAD